MGARASRLQEDPVPIPIPVSPFGKDAAAAVAKRDSCRRARCPARPTSLVVDFSVSFDDAEANQSRSEEEEGSPSPSPSPDKPEEEEEGAATEAPADPEQQQQQQSEQETGSGRTPHRTFSERLPGNRHSSARSAGSARSARVRGSHQRPVSEAWIGLYRVNNRHGNIRCPFCSKPFPGGRIEDHLLNCLTSPPLPYNTDVLNKDSGECSICLEDLVQGETIARLACLCIYHKSCIDSWSKVKPCCPEHPFD
ncbi:E3 ubiquitin-protein ligase ZNRF2 [Cololabis saira]|uniref:E3 ubiquitin-protein ligase ZNRF2 n=1 Tax=Cololabis saira TaxID=129043 RepID=UPI002AD21B61|nr:E3 ubiquitin-protein ligase ZNRF2 [Cololabis saira]